MEIPVLVEPCESGFCASTQSPLPLSAEGSTADTAVDALTTLISDRLRAGAQLRTIRLPDLQRIRAAGDALVNNPFHAEWLKGIEEYRRVHNAVPDGDE